MSDSPLNPQPTPNPRRVAAGKRNYALRQGLSEEGRRKLSATARRHEPWRHATGPTTPQGKKTASRNGKKRQIGPQSVRELRAELSELGQLLNEMREAHASAEM